MTSNSASTRRRLHQLLILGVLIFAVWLRLWQLPQLPPGFWYDEAYNAMDALWMFETGSPVLFFLGNTGREPMLHYLGAVSMAVLGASPYAFRLVSALAGILTLPLLYRWLISFFADNPNRRWLALFATAGFAFSFWHVILSRTGFRAVLLPLFLVLTLYLFWRGWQQGQRCYFVFAGLALGFAQYTYLAVRLLPPVLILFALLWTFLGRQSAGIKPSQSVKNLWVGLLITAGVAAIVFLPLAIFFMNNLTIFFGRAGQVSVWNSIATGNVSLIEHLTDAVRVFFDGYDPNWRHDINGRSTFGWLNIIFFWTGVIVALRHIRRPQYLFLVILLGAFWLPGLLSTPPVHALRLSGMLPAYFAFVGIGLTSAVAFVTEKMHRPQAFKTAGILVMCLLLFLNGGRTTRDFFYRWANQAVVYQEYEAPLVDLVTHLINQSQEFDIVLPVAIYGHPAARLLLHDPFPETPQPASNISERPVLVVTPLQNLPHRGNSASYVWLTRRANGTGAAYISPQPWPFDVSLNPTRDPIPFTDPHTDTPIALLTPVENIRPLRPLFTEQPVFKEADYQWVQQFRLLGYQIAPDPVKSGESLVVTLFWHILTAGQGWPYNTVTEIVDPAGRVISQSKFSTQELFAWRSGGTITAQDHFYIGPELPPGPYLVRLTLTTSDNAVVSLPDGTQQVTIGLFYVAPESNDPRRPPVPLSAQFGHQIKLLGYAPPEPLGNNIFRGKLYFKTYTRLEDNYTMFIQLLDADNQIRFSWESQPLAGYYPTVLWQPGETVVSEFDLVLPDDLPSGKYRLVAGMFNAVTQTKLPASGGNKQPQPDNVVTLTEITIP